MSFKESLDEIDDGLLSLYDKVSELEGSARDIGYDYLQEVCIALDCLEEVLGGTHERQD